MPSHCAEILGGYDVSTLVARELPPLEGLQQIQAFEKGTDFSAKHSLDNFLHLIVTYDLYNTPAISSLQLQNIAGGLASI